MLKIYILNLCHISIDNPLYDLLDIEDDVDERTID